MFSTILVCAQLVLNGDMTLGGLTACMMLSSRALQPIQQSASFWIKLPAVRQAKEQVALIEELEKDLNTDIPEEQPADLMGEVSVENLSFRYAETEPWIAEDLSFSIPARTSLAITGPSKNGSTTLMMMLLGLLNPEKGRVCIDNIPLDKLSSSTLDGKVQYLPRNGMLFKGSILDNITTFKPQLQPLALSSATLLGLDPIIAALPQGYETMVDSRSRLSTEIIHRITLARSLVHRPRILIADKTTASMDRRSEEAFLELLELLKPMCTIIIITQWPQLLEWCDQAYEFKHGKFGPYSPKKKSWFS
jgi:ATP-binding cassette subfamily C protein LapB